MTDNVCLYCDEPVLVGVEPCERMSLVMDDKVVGRYVHVECSARSVIGSVGHQQGLCSCDGGPGTMDDPPGMTRRQAAQAALEYYRNRRSTPPDSKPDSQS